MQISLSQASGGQQPLMIDTIKRHEVDRVLNTQGEIIQEARQIRYGIVLVNLWHNCFCQLMA